nr:modular serine protease [Drosophila kikkawai]
MISLYFLDFTLAFVCITKQGNTIKAHEICNGIIDCCEKNEPNCGDERFALCYNKKCDDETKFQCTYGGCLDRALRCDGKTDCWDGSDENDFECLEGAALENAYEDLKGEYEGDQILACEGKEPLPWSLVCDGQADCRDGRDEDPKLCSAIECEPPHFRCLYGACVSQKALCNHVLDCLDGSDEISEICQELHPQTKNSQTQGFKATSNWDELFCSLENDPSNSLIVENYVGNNTFRPNAKVPQDTVVSLSCKPGFRLDGKEKNICTGNSWRYKLAKCVKECKHTASVLQTRKCTLNELLIDCDQPMLPQGTRMTVFCASGAEHETPGVQICDADGIWVIFRRGHEANFTFVCKATILSPYILVTTEECFRDITIKSVPSKEPVLYTVAEGHPQTFSFWAHGSHPYKLHNVSLIHTFTVSEHPLALVQLLHPLEFGACVRPVCLTEEAPRNFVQVVDHSVGLMGAAVISEKKGRYELSAIISSGKKYHISAFIKDIQKDIELTESKGNI